MSVKFKDDKFVHLESDVSKIRSRYRQCEDITEDLYERAYYIDLLEMW